MRARIDCLLAHDRETYLARVGDFDLAFGEECASLDRALGAIERANEPTVQPAGHFDPIAQLAGVEFANPSSARRLLLQDEEMQMLSLRKGTLSEAETHCPAVDRPYKRVEPIERALHVLDLAVKDGELDDDLFSSFR